MDTRLLTDVPTGADQALSRGQSMHRLHNATVAPASDEVDSDSDERLAMLFEGSFGCGGRDGHRVDTSILFDSGATSNFVSPRLLKQLAVNYSPSSATLRLADASSVPILGLTFAQDLWWKGDRIVVPDSSDTKKLILQAFHDHPMAGHFGVRKTLAAINSRFYWPFADREV
ncbi:MAG: hypothetical protein FRX49_01989 [Trebouxia sp. A1-2]|nr:MAG: hypothetical protein FRX49_01989 [Trebouxia sp. A1-2]